MKYLHCLTVWTVLIHVFFILGHFVWC